MPYCCTKWTEIQVLQVAGTEAPSPLAVTLAGGEVCTAKEFKYLGGWTQEGWSVSREVEVRRGRALGVFQSFNNVWTHKQLQVAHKMAVYNTFILPHFLYGAETWNCTSAQVHALETAHSACLRRILGVTRAERHTLQHIRQVCGSQPLELMLIKRTLQWLGHVARMPGHRYPTLVLDCVPVGGKRGQGRPAATFRHAYARMLTGAIVG